MRRAKVAAALLAVLLLVILAVQNPSPIEFKFLWMTLPVPKIILVVASALVGALTTLIVQLLMRSGIPPSGSSSTEGPSEF